jgi:hypothetical protein
MHQKTWNEVLEGALSACGGDTALRGGQLVDAEA